MAKLNEGQTTELNKRLDAMRDAGLKQQQAFHTIWRDGLNYVYDNQLSGKARRKGWERISINYIWPATIQEIALLTQQTPEIICLPGSNDETDVSGAQVWQGGIQWQWDKDLNMTLKRAAALLDTKIFGYAVIKTWWEDKHQWDENSMDWEGRTSVALVHPMFFWADPESETQDNWENCGTRRNVKLGWAKQRWPEMAKDLEAEADQADFKDKEGQAYGEDWYMNLKNVDKGTVDEGRITSIIGAARSSEYQPSATTDGQADRSDDRILTIEEFYFKDYATKKLEIPEQVPIEELAAQGQARMDPDGKVRNPQDGSEWTEETWPTRVKRVVQEPVYPHGRVILRVGKTILNPDPAQQRWKYSAWPFNIIPNYILPHIWQGMNAVEMSRPLQNWINVCASHFTNYLKYFGDPAWVVEEGVLAKDPDNKKTRQLSPAGAIIQVIRGTINKIRRESPPPMPAGVFEFFQLMAQEIRNQTGMQEVVQGIAGRGGMTATENTRLNANSRLRVALQSNIQEQCIRRIAEQIAEIDQKNWSIGRWQRIVGPNKVQSIQEITNEIKQAKFDIDIKIGTAMPFDEEKRKADYVQMAEFLANPAYTVFLPELLHEFDIANAEEVLKRHDLFQQFQQLQPILPYMQQILQLPQVQQMFAQIQQAQRQQQQQPQKGVA